MLARNAMNSMLVILLASDVLVAQGTPAKTPSTPTQTRVSADAPEKAVPPSKTQHTSPTVLSTAKDFAATVESICIALAALLGSGWWNSLVGS